MLLLLLNYTKKQKQKKFKIIIYWSLNCNQITITVGDILYWVTKYKYINNYKYKNKIKNNKNMIHIFA